MPGGQTSVSMVTVGNPGNAPDTTGYGAVSYVYKMDKYDVTTAQYTQFLNAVAATDTYGLYYQPEYGHGLSDRGHHAKRQFRQLHLFRDWERQRARL
jgi:hypothetical protein